MIHKRVIACMGSVLREIIWNRVDSVTWKYMEYKNILHVRKIKFLTDKNVQIKEI